MNAAIKIMLVEDHPRYREVIELAIEEQADMQMSGKFGAAEVALRSLQDMTSRVEPDTILLDLNLPSMSGLEALPYFKQAAPLAKVIVLTQSNKESDVLQAIQSGADGYLLKSSSIKEITQAIRLVMSGGATLDANVARFIIAQLQSRPHKTEEPQVELSTREIQILTLLGEGLQKKEIAEQLGIGSSTVATFVKRIYEKLNVTNAPAAITKAYKTGILPGA